MTTDQTGGGQPGDAHPAKTSHWRNGEWVARVVPATYELPVDASSLQRIVAGASTRGAEVFQSLVGRLEPPYLLLYVLHTPRGEGEAGRYQSPPLDAAQFAHFMTRFGGYLTGDARFDLWVHSPAQRATIVWDRHDVLFAYGPLDGFANVLEAMGYTQASSQQPEAHAHHYRAEFDEDAAELLALAWTRSDLRPEDEQ